MIIEYKANWAPKEAGKEATALGDGTQGVHLKFFPVHHSFFSMDEQ